MLFKCAIHSEIIITNYVIMRITKGFSYMGKPYGWYNNTLYRLPYFHKQTKRWYDLKKCADFKVKGVKKGYCLGSVRKSFRQIEAMLEDYDVEVKVY